MKESYFDGFEVVQDTQGEQLEIRIVKTNDSTCAALYENENGEICIFPNKNEELMLVRGAFLAVVNIIDKHINAK
jgi:hypothetical protein